MSSGTYGASEGPLPRAQGNQDAGEQEGRADDSHDAQASGATEGWQRGGRGGRPRARRRRRARTGQAEADLGGHAARLRSLRHGRRLWEAQTCRRNFVSRMQVAEKWGQRQERGKRESGKRRHGEGEDLNASCAAEMIERVLFILNQSTIN